MEFAVRKAHKRPVEVQGAGHHRGLADILATFVVGPGVFGPGRDLALTGFVRVKQYKKKAAAIDRATSRPIRPHLTGSRRGLSRSCVG